MARSRARGAADGARGAEARSCSAQRRRPPCGCASSIRALYSYRVRADRVCTVCAYLGGRRCAGAGAPPMGMGHGALSPLNMSLYYWLQLYTRDTPPSPFQKIGAPASGDRPSQTRRHLLGLNTPALAYPPHNHYTLTTPSLPRIFAWRLIRRPSRDATARRP